MPKHTRYSDFLKERQFIRWQLMPDEEINKWWDDFIIKHPESVKEIQQAINYLKTEGLNKSTLSEAEHRHLFNQIQTTIIRDRKRVKMRRFFLYTAASCAAIALVVIGIALFSPEKTTSTEYYNDLIVGEMLNSEDIQLITSDEAHSFQNDVEVTLDERGTAEITQNNKEVKTIKINQDKRNSLIVPFGKRSTLTLADGSRVWLNSGSVLEFPAQFPGKNRTIRLASGEMYIEVAPDKLKPFYVQTSSFQVKVYGTAFNLSVYDESSSSVVLVEGSVALQSPGGKEEVTLKPDELAAYDPQSGLFSLQTVEVDSFISWKEGYLSLNKTPMPELLKRIERYYNLSFNYDQDVNLQKRTCTGKIYLSDNLDNVMTTIALLSSTRYEKENNSIYITNEP
ncbi:MAG: FecR domain-containing protein [Proteiniphilum sp.]|nr:FecR domain-containing protein [Proteiniphilum sp.]